MIELNSTERNIIEVLGNNTLTFEQLAAKAGYEVSDHFKRTVTLLSKLEILGDKKVGYLVQPYFQRIGDEL